MKKLLYIMSLFLVIILGTTALYASYYALMQTPAASPPPSGDALYVSPLGSGNKLGGDESNLMPWGDWIDGTSRAANDCYVRDMNHVVTATWDWPECSGYYATTVCNWDDGRTAGAAVDPCLITITFDDDYEIGQYAARDLYVIDPGGGSPGVTIVSSSPAETGPTTLAYDPCETHTEYWLNVCEKNAILLKQGCDSRGYRFGTVGEGGNYRFAMGNTIVAGDYLRKGASVGAVTGEAPDGRVQLGQYSVNHPFPRLYCALQLNCLAAKPASKAFRPANIGSIRDHYLLADMDATKFMNVAAPESDDLPTSTGALSTISGNWYTRDLGELDNYNGYYNTRETNPDCGYGSRVMYRAMLLCHTNINATDKDHLIRQIVQYGIDAWGCMQEGATGGETCGQIGRGRKGPLVALGALFEDADILTHIDDYGRIALKPDSYLYRVDEAYTNNVRFPSITRENCTVEADGRTITIADPGEIQNWYTAPSNVGWPSGQADYDDTANNKGWPSGVYITLTYDDESVEYGRAEDYHTSTTLLLSTVVGGRYYNSLVTPDTNVTVLLERAPTSTIGDVLYSNIHYHYSAKDYLAARGYLDSFGPVNSELCLVLLMLEDGYDYANNADPFDFADEAIDTWTDAAVGQGKRYQSDFHRDMSVLYWDTYYASPR